MIEFWPPLRTFAVHCNWHLSNLGWLIIWYLDTSLVCVASFSLASCDVIALINFTVLLCIIFMHMFYRIMKRIYQFAVNLLSYISTKYYWNRSTSDLVIVKNKRVNFFLKHSVVPYRIIWSWYTGRWWVGRYIWYSEEGTGRGRSPPRFLLAVPNVTAHPSTACVPITVLLFSGPLLCGLMCPL